MGQQIIPKPSGLGGKRLDIYLQALINVYMIGLSINISLSVAIENINGSNTLRKYVWKGGDSIELKSLFNCGLSPYSQ